MSTMGPTASDAPAPPQFATGEGRAAGAKGARSHREKIPLSAMPPASRSLLQDRCELPNCGDWVMTRHWSAGSQPVLSH